MSGFFSRLFGRKPEVPVDEEPKAVREVLDEKSIPTTATVLNQVILNLTYQQKGEYSILDIQKFEQFLATCPPLAIGLFDFQAYEAGPHHGGWFAHVFIRNAVSVDNDLSLHVIPLSLYDALGEKIAAHVFELDMQPLKFGEARLHTFFWPGETSLKPLALADLTKFRVDMV